MNLSDMTDDQITVGMSPKDRPAICACCAIRPQRPGEITCEQCAGHEDNPLDFLPEHDAEGFEPLTIIM